MNVKNNHGWRSIWITVCSQLSILNSQKKCLYKIRDLRCLELYKICALKEKKMCCTICMNDSDISAAQTSWH